MWGYMAENGPDCVKRGHLDFKEVSWLEDLGVKKKFRIKGFF